MTMTIGPQRAAARPTRDGRRRRSTTRRSATESPRGTRPRSTMHGGARVPCGPIRPTWRRRRRGMLPRADSGSNRTSTGGRRAGTGARRGRSRDEPVRAAAPAQPAKAQARAADDDDETVEDSPRRKSPAPQRCVRPGRPSRRLRPPRRRTVPPPGRPPGMRTTTTMTRRRARPRRNRNGDRRSPRPTRRAARGSTKDDDDDDEDVAPRSRRRNATDDDRRQKANQLANAKDRNGRTASTKGGRDASVTRVAASDARRPTSGKHGRGAADSDGDPKLPPPGRFTVQVGPYRNRKQVEVAREDLSRRGYEAKVVGQSLQLGNFTQKGLADRLAGRLRVSGHPATSATLR